MRNNFIFLFFMISSICKAQIKDCALVNDTFYLVSLDIRGGSYPITMNGITAMKNLKKLKATNSDSLLNSFYKICYYVPQIPDGTINLVWTCLGESGGYTYLKDHKLILEQEFGRIKSNSIKSSQKLESKETVYIEITIIGGSFWKIIKENYNFKGSSNEKDINNIPQIQLCYIPFEINYFKKPKRSNCKINYEF